MRPAASRGVDRGSPDSALALIVAGVLLACLPAGANAQEFAFEFGDPGRPEPERLGTTNGIAIDADGNPWVADLQNERIAKYGYDGGFVASFTQVGNPPVPVGIPSGIAADDQGFIYVARASPDPRVLKLDTGGILVSQFTLRDAAGNVITPDKIDIDASGRLYVSDGINTVHVYTAGGDRVGQIRLPAGNTVIDVAIDDDEVLILFSTLTPDQHGIDRFGLDRTRIGTLGPFNDVNFREIAVDQAGRLNVTDHRASVVRRFDRTAGVIDAYGTRGIGVGEMNGPDGIDVDCRGNIYVVDSAARFDGEGGPRAGSKVLKFVTDPTAPPPPCAPRPLPDGAIDTQVNDVEVTQAIQPAFSHTAGPILAPGQQAFTIPENVPRARAYGSAAPGGATGEVPLKANLKTVVRVYANLNQGPAGGIANVPATLEAVTASGQTLGPIQALAKPALLRVGGRTVDFALRSSPIAAYTFDLPNEWTLKGTLDLTARVNPAAIGCDAQCQNRSTFRLTGVPFGIIRAAPIAPIALTDNGQRPVNDSARAFAVAQRVTPLLLEVQPWRAQAEVGDLIGADSITIDECFIGIFPCDDETYGPDSPEFREYLQGELWDRLEEAAEDAEIDECTLVPIGIVRDNNNLPGSMSGEFLAEGLFPCALGYAEFTPPAPMSIPHELQHAFGRPHAGQGCPGTGEDDDQAGEPWPPDDRGLLGGIGLDTYARFGGAAGPHDVIAPGVGGRAAELFDLMSYCNAGDNAKRWISPRGWTNLTNWRVPRPTHRKRGGEARGQSGGRLLRVTAIELANGQLGISGVSPVSEAEPADAASPYVLEALDEAGAVLASAPASASGLADSGSKLITGTVPAPDGTAQVFLRRGMEIGTRRVATANPPRVNLLSPQGGSRVNGGQLTVRWKAKDPDGGELGVTVEYSADGGRRWRGVHIGPDAGTAKVPRALLTGSRNARIRIRVDDGFNEDSAVSKRFTVAASPPVVRITDPAGKLTIGADAPLTLRGEAYMGDGRRLAPRKLRWSDGSRPLGRGESLTVESLEAGRHLITLTAGQGQLQGRASTTVVVRAVKPAFLRLDAPTKVKPRARKVRLLIASTVDAALHAGGKRFTVSPRARAVKVPLDRGKEKVRLELRAGRLSTSYVLTVPRG